MSAPIPLPLYVYRIEEDARDSEVAGPFWTTDAAEYWISEYIKGDDALDVFDIRLSSAI